MVFILAGLSFIFAVLLAFAGKGYGFSLTQFGQCLTIFLIFAGMALTFLGLRRVR